MSLSSLETIEKNVQFDNDNFSMIDTYGSMIVNHEYDKGFVDFKHKYDTADAFMYMVLSAIGQDITDTLYLNVKKYIDFVADVDVCKTTSLRSMLNMLGFKYTIFNQFDKLPLGILNLIDVLSINKKYLLRKNIMRNEFLSALADLDKQTGIDAIFQLDSDKTPFRRFFVNNAYVLSTSNDAVDFNEVSTKKLNGLYECSGFILSDAYSMFEDINISTFSEISASKSYFNRSGYFITEDIDADSQLMSSITIYANDTSKIMTIQSGELDGLQEIGDTTYQQLSNFYEFDLDSAISDANYAFMEYNQSAWLSISLSNTNFSDDLDRFSEQKYEQFLEYVYSNYITMQLLNTYSAEFVENRFHEYVYIYPFLNKLYYDDAIQNSINEFDGFDYDTTLSLRMFYNVSKQFDEKAILDRIEDGTDSIDNYAGAELSLILNEKQNRSNPLNFDKIGKDGNVSRIPQTRYSYYREKKVAEYAHFVDNYYSSIKITPNVYDFDNNYFLLDDAACSCRVIDVKDINNIRPQDDINTEMISVVSKYLTQLTLYISKIRDKIKLQTQKNYMKGTNLLLIYIINEYLIEYSRHNREKFLELDANGNIAYPELCSVYSCLSNHQFSDDGGMTYTIGINEFYDPTEYMNISTDSSVSSTYRDVNRRYWELTSAAKTKMMGYDGNAFKLAEIERFYLSTLNMKHDLGTTNSDLTNFLSTIYDLGANNSFVANISGVDQFSESSSDVLSLFSSTLENGEYASDVFKRLVDLSSARKDFNKYLKNSEYKYINDTVDRQIYDVTHNYIYKNMSAEYLSAISTTYNAHIAHAVGISTDMMTLSTDYMNFISGDYQFYFVKSKQKWCYSDLDPVAGSYQHQFYVQSPDYDTDDMNLYQHLQSFKAYASNQENIQNHSLLAAIDYISANFNGIRTELTSTVINTLVSKYKYVDINAPALDDQLGSVNTYVKELISDRKAALQAQIDSLKEQANSLKSQYDSLNNTFIAAVANYNDNTAGTKLGDSYVYEFTTYKTSTWPSGGSNYETDGEGKCSRVAASDTDRPTKGYDFVVYVSDLNVWYFGEDPNGDYMYRKNKIPDDKVYNANSSLEEKCDQLLAYLNMPTLITASGQESKSLMSEGIAAVADTIKTSLDRCKETFEKISTLAGELGIDTNWSSTDISGKIDDLISALASVTVASLDDITIYELNQLLAKIATLSGEYLPIKEAYEQLFTDTEQTKYLTDFQPNFNLTMANLQALNNYCIVKDLNSYNSIIEFVNQLLDTRFPQLIRDAQDEISELNSIGLDVIMPYGNDVELYISRIVNALLDDIAAKRDDAMQKINAEKTKIIYYCDIFEKELSSELSTTIKFNIALSAAIDRLNFFEHDIYQSWHNVFLTYGGQDFCYDPYYNIKNMAHPSYQIHPFLWNLVQKQQTETLIERGFKSHVVAEIAEYESLSKLNSIIGEYGQTINTWRNYSKGLVDYSGYVTRYEKSSNQSPATGDVNEVVDYDGAFYPPAIDDFRTYPAGCIQSIIDHAEIINVFQKIERVLTADMSSYMTYNENTGVILSSRIYSEIQPIVSAYYLTTNISDEIQNYICSKNSRISAINNEEMLQCIGNGIPQTFYEKYYKHLDLTIPQYQHIAEQLKEYQAQILDITSDKTNTNVNDIYKYGLDVYGNSYILYKTYDYSNLEQEKDLTFKQKQDTLGELWIRLAHHPIAFPAFSGRNPAEYIYTTSLWNPALLKLALSIPDGVTYGDRRKTTIISVNSPMRFFYDFEFTQDKAGLVFFIKNDDVVDMPPFNGFGLSWAITDRIHTKYDKSIGLEWLTYSNTNDSGNIYTIDYIDFNSKNGRIVRYRNKNDLFGEDLDLDGVRYPTLIGYYVYDQYAIDLVYVYKKYRRYFDEDGVQRVEVTISNVDDKPQRLQKNGYDDDKAFFIVTIKNGTTISTLPRQGATRITQLKSNKLSTIGDLACAGFDMHRRYVALAFTTLHHNELSNIIDVNPPISAIDFYENTEGAIITDPLAPEMNSHDEFDTHVTVLEFKKKSDDLQFKNTYTYNINADISYIPSYPGMNGEIEIYKKYSNADYFSIELLGMSKDIDNYIAMVNPNPDPYFSYDTILSNTVYGRVWEDYNPSEDKTFIQITNPSLNGNSPTFDSSNPYKYSTAANWELNIFELTWHMNNIPMTPYNSHDYETMQILIYNTMSLGKNPYFIGKLKDLEGIPTHEEDWVELHYNEPNVGDNSSEISVESTIGSGHTVAAAGVQRRLSATGKYGSNYIEHVYRITALYFDKCLTLRFYHDGDKYAHIPPDTIQFVFFNDKDLTLFKYYHLLDAHGAINCLYIEEAIQPNNIDFDGWGIYYDSSIRKQDELSDLLRSFYLNKYGGKQYLSDIELSSYDALSDVYVFNGIHRLGFKYDEELHFDLSSKLYYYPTLNISYPQTPGTYIIGDQSFTKDDQTNLSILDQVFDEYNLFTIDIDDPLKLVNTIGKIDIPIIYNDVNDVRAFEDWLDDGPDGIPNYKKYDAGDTRAYQYMHFFSGSKPLTPSTYTNERQMPIDDYVWQNRTLDNFTASCDTVYGCVPMTSEELTSYVGMEYVTIDPTSCDISPMTKLYVNYKRDRYDNDALVLYFNYFNYINSPYVKIENGTQIKLDIIPNTYLKLKPDEDGILDIVVQFKHYCGDVLIGYKNCKLLSYRISNVSDDKPKFVIQKVYEASKDQFRNAAAKTTVDITLFMENVSLNDFNTPQNALINMPLYIDFIKNKQLKNGSQFYIEYPLDVIQLDMSNNTSNYGYYFLSDSEPGIAHIEINNPLVDRITLDFKSTRTFGNMASFQNKYYMVSLLEPLFVDVDDTVAIVNVEDAEFMLTKTDVHILASTNKHQSQANRENHIIIANSLKQFIQVK